MRSAIAVRASLFFMLRVKVCQDWFADRIDPRRLIFISKI